MVDSEYTVQPLAQTRSIPGHGLPDLQELRGKEPNTPKVPHAIASTRCSTHNPDCTRRKLSRDESQTDLLAWGLNFPSAQAISGETYGPVADSPFRLFWSRPALLAAQPTRPQANRTNVALAANGGVASASSTYSSNYPASSVINGDRKGLNWNNGGGWNDSTPNAYPDWLQIDFNGTKTLDEIDIFTAQDNIGSPTEPTETMTFGLYGVTGFEVQYWNGTTWVTVPNGNVASNNLVWRKLTFQSLTTSKIRISINNALWSHSRIIEVEAYGTEAVPRTNVALAANGGVVSASSTYSSAYPAGATNDGDRKGLNWNQGGGWNDATAHFYPDWLQVDFNGAKLIDEIDLFTIQDNPAGPAEPTEAMTFTSYGIVDFEVQYWNGASWARVPGGYVTGNNKVWRKFIFTPLTTTKIRVVVNNALAQHSRVVEIEAYGTQAGEASSDFSTSRLDPANRTGRGGVDLLSRNANWSLPLLGLKGRAGLDLELSLSYNSLVWTKNAQSNSIKFDADRGTPSPGFRLGLPVVQPFFYNPQTGKNGFLLITPSGAHVELRQVGSSNIYEAGDSSYLQLIDQGSGSLTLRPTDGSQLSYRLYDGQYQCTEIKDRNGNYISVSYHADGRINTVRDTLARIITFNYDSYNNLSKLTQTQTVGNQQQTHEWVTFGWSNITLQTGFPGLTVVGPQNGSVIPVLTSVGLDNGTYYKFRYNSWGQVDKVTFYAADSQQGGLMLDTHPLNYTSYMLEAAAGGQPDCPRVSEVRVWAEHWTGQNGVPSEVVTHYSTAWDGSSGQATLPDGAIYKEFYGTGWQKGLPTITESWSGGIKKKWTTTTWTQDNTSLPYEQNPRVLETNIYDSDGNRKRTAIQYSEYPQWGLPSRVIEYAPDGTTEIRHTFTGYEMSQDYLDKRIIGLVKAIHVSDTLTWQSIIYYAYDAGGTQLIATPNTTIQHDAAYDNSWQRRGNLTKITRYDVTDIENSSKRAMTHFGYDTNGSLIFTLDPLNHQARISYEDSFSDANNARHTYAYPTKQTPPLHPGENGENFSATAQYNYDLGVVTRTQGPAPAGHAQGAIQTFEYDSAGRLSRVNNLVNNSYSRWVYEPQGHVTLYSLVQAGAQETSRTTVFDGMGRVRATSADHPNSAGGHRGQYTQYDLMGRVFRQSNPIEINQLWEPKGDDLAGWVWTEQAYDWQGRPTLTTNPDGTTREAVYGGCGCAGGEVITVRDEAGRRQRMTSDVLGRTVKSEDLNWDGSIYRSLTNIYNARDQITQIAAQSESSGATQFTIMTYDGYGRLATRKLPAQSSATSYAYYADDMLQTVTDARGASTSYSYNSRHLTTNVTYSAPTGIAAAPNVAFGYDAAGNRLWMTDGEGRVDYQYDTLSQLQAETRQFSGVGSYAFAYEYTLSGELKKITGPFGSINYDYDRVGRLSAVTSTGGSVSSYVTNMQYRAWGAVKGLTYGNGHTLTANYNNRLQTSRFEIKSSTGTTLMGLEFQYTSQAANNQNNDGRVKYARDLTQGQLDRFYKYDHVGRLSQGLTGMEAKHMRDYGQENWSAIDGPYWQIYGYDEWDNLSYRVWRGWEAYQADPGRYNPTREYYSASYVNGRNTAWQYDAEGNAVSTNSLGDTFTYAYDSAGRLTSTTKLGGGGSQSYDGDGQKVKQIESGTTTYYLRSSALDGLTVAELNGSGILLRSYVYADDDEPLVMQENNQARWYYRDPINSKIATAGASGGEFVGKIEFDPLGVKVDDDWARYSMGNQAPRPVYGVDQFYERAFGRPRDPSMACYVDGVERPCQMVLGMLHNGSALQCPDNVCNRLNWNTRQFERYGTEGWRALDPSGGWTQGIGVVDARTGAGWLKRRKNNRSGWSDPRYGVNQLLFLGSSFTLPQNQERRLTSDEVRKIREKLAKLLTDKCKSFINKLVSHIQGSAYDSGKQLLGDFDRVDKQRGFFFGPVATAGGAIANENAKVIIWNTLSGLKGYDPGYAALTALHELIHVLVNRGDPELAEDVYDAGLKTEKPPTREEVEKDPLVNGRYWDGALKEACKPKGY